MIGLKKTPIGRSVKRKRVSFRRFAAYTDTGAGSPLAGMGGENAAVYENGALYAKRSENCDFSENGLRPTAQAEPLLTGAGNRVRNLPTERVKQVFCVRLNGLDGAGLFERYLFLLNNGFVELYDEAQASFALGEEIGARAHGVEIRVVNGAEGFLTVGEKKGMLFRADEVFYPSPKKDVTRVLCCCKNRVFALLKNGRLAYSDPMNPLDFSESIDGGGYIELPTALGSPSFLTAVEEYVYVFFARAIVRVTVKGSGKDFCVERLPYVGERIVWGSVCPIGDGVIFLAGDGLWIVRGLRAQPFCRGFLPRPYEGSAEGAECNAAVYKEQYFLRYPIAEGTFRSVVVGLDGKSWSDCYDLSGLSAGFDAPVFVRQGSLYQLGGAALPSGEKAVFESTDTDFGWRGRKALRRLELIGEGQMTVRIACDGRYVQRRATFSDGKAVLDLGVRGESFSFVFELGQGSVLYGMRAQLEG